MSNKRVTNEHIHRELGEISVLLQELRNDINEVKEMAPRIRSLELFKSYVMGCAGVIVLISGTVLAILKDSFRF